MEDSSPFAKVIKKVKVHYVHVAILTVIVSIIHRQICRMASIILFQSSGCVWCSCIWLHLRATVPLSHVATPLGLFAEVLCPSVLWQLQF